MCRLDRARSCHNLPAKQPSRSCRAQLRRRHPHPLLTPEMLEMDPELRAALEERRLISGDILPTEVASEADSSSIKQIQADESLAFTQIQSLLIGANQAVEGRMPSAIKHFISQIRSVVSSCPSVVE